MDQVGVHLVSTLEDLGHAGVVLFEDGAGINGELVHLTRTEYAILVLLLKHRNRFYNRRQIFDQVWRDADPSANDRIVDTNISRLRKKLGASAEALVNRTGEGYALID